MAQVERKNDVRLNLSKTEALIRAGIAFILPIGIIFYQALWFIIVICMITAYLLATSFTLFCWIKSIFVPVKETHPHNPKNESGSKLTEL